jgi:glycosyltransferase involved in cell wall biosynthesis
MSTPGPQDPQPHFAAARAAVALSWADPRDGARPDPQTPELAALVEDVLGATDQAARMRATWLLLVTLTGAMPSLQEVENAWLGVATGGPTELVVAAVGEAIEPIRSRLSRCLGGTLVDVTITAGTDNYSGVPRVVRQLVSAWGEPPGVHYVVWEAQGVRTLDGAERARLGLTPDTTVPPGTWVVPWDATYVVAEVMRPEAHATAVEAMAFAGVIDLRGIVYDLASLVEPNPDATRGPFLYHLAALSRGSRVSGISQAIAADLSDYYAIFARNGRPQPHVESHVLPEEAGSFEGLDERVAVLDSRVRGDQAWPVVTVVSSLHPRKNHRRLFAACEQLWEEGLRFRLLAVEGTRSRTPSVARAVGRLVERGRPVTLLSQLSDPDLRAAYRLARLTAYVSLAEGYGLPIVESLAAGTPVIASGHGSMAEVAKGGGVLLVDPRDEESVVAGLRRCLTEPALYDDLLAGAVARSRTTWGDYARSVGSFLGVLDETWQSPPEGEHDVEIDNGLPERSGRTG